MTACTLMSARSASACFERPACTRKCFRSVANSSGFSTACKVSLTARCGRNSDGRIEDAADGLYVVDDQAVEIDRVEESGCIGDPQIVGILVVEIDVLRKEQLAEQASDGEKEAAR